MPPKGRTPGNPPRRRPRVAGLHQPPRPTTPDDDLDQPPPPGPDADQTETAPPAATPTRLPADVDAVPETPVPETATADAAPPAATQARPPATARETGARETAARARRPAEAEAWADEAVTVPAVIETPDFAAPDPGVGPPEAEAEFLADAEPDRAEAEPDRAEAEPDQADTEPDQADTEPDRAGAEPDRAQAEPGDAQTAEIAAFRRSRPDNRADKTPDGAFHSRRRHTGLSHPPQAAQPIPAAPGGRRRATSAQGTTDGEPAPTRAPTRAQTKAQARAQAQTQPRPRRLRSLQAIAFFVMVAVVFGAAALIFRGEAGRASTGSAENRALVDTVATTEVVGQVSKAIEVVLSYDYTKLDDNDRASHEVITGKYADEFNKTFADVREVSPKQKLTVTTTVLLAGVTSLSGDRAEVIATMDLNAVRDTTPYNSPGRVRVVASKVDGRWKIAEMYLL